MTMIHVKDNLYQGDREDAIRVSRSKEVDAIVYVGQEFPIELIGSQIPVVHLPFKDGEGNLDLQFHLAIANIQYLTLDDRTLVACRGGISRSPLIVAMVLALDQEFPDLQLQIQKVKEKISQTQINQTLLKTAEKAFQVYLEKVQLTE